MNWETVLIYASLILVLVVIVGGNIWALRGTPLKESEELSREIHDLIENEARRT
jgi:hypothetical protein